MKPTEKVRITEINTGAGDRAEGDRPDWLKGFFVALTILAMLAFWGGFAYAVWARDMGLVMVFVAIIAVGAAVFGTIQFLTKLAQHISKS
jgi:hypothetical protein